MKLLLDTCAILWLTEPRRLSLAARTAIRNNPLELFASAISAFEIGLKHRKGRINLGMDVHVWWPRIVDHHGLSVAPVSSEVALDPVLYQCCMLTPAIE